MGPQPVLKMEASLHNVQADVTRETTERPKNATSASLLLWPEVLMLLFVLNNVEERDPNRCEQHVVSWEKSCPLPKPNKILRQDLDGVGVTLVGDCHRNASVKLESTAKPEMSIILGAVFILLWRWSTCGMVQYLH